MITKSYFHYLGKALLGKIHDRQPAFPVLPNGLVQITLTSSLPGVGKTVTAKGLKYLLEQEGAKVFVFQAERTPIPMQANGYVGMPTRDQVELLTGGYHYLIVDGPNTL